jgi:hypothetical protein
MALSQADFYAYSRATGAPLPESAEERAQIAPDVLEFRRNQLKQQPEGGNLVDTLGKAALGAGAIVAAGLGASRLLQKPAAAQQKVYVRPETVQKVAQTPVPTVVATTSETARPPIPRPPAPTSAPTAATPAPSKQPPGAEGALSAYLQSKGYVAPVQEAEYVALRPDVRDVVSVDVAEARRKAATEGLLAAAAQRKEAYQTELPGTTLMAVRAPVAAPGEVTGELPAAAPSRPLAIAPEQLSLDLVETQQASRPFNVDQAINALDSGEDQMTGRVRQQLQRNEDINLASVDQLEDMTGNIDVAVSQMEDGIPFDQAEAGRSFALDMMQSQRERLAARGFKGQQLERRLVYPQSVAQGVEASLPVSAEDALTVGRAEPTQIAPGGFVSPASKTSLRGTTGRPELGVLGIESGSTPQREVWGQGAVETQKTQYSEGENPVTRPTPFRPGINLPQERTPEGYVYTQAAMTRPSKPGASRTPLTQPKTDVGRESVELSEQVRRIQREGGDVQAFLDEYKRGRI